VHFVTWLGLGVALLAAVPYLAHRLRRRRAEEIDFAPARLVPSALPKARRRSELEDRPLFLVRALAVLALAALGASPLVRCSRLALDRAGGASVALALVLDDSMSMRARATPDAKTRFERAREGARQLLASVREGDAVAVVLAGAPARVLLAATTDLAAARAAVEAAKESDRATDLEGALATARSLIQQLPQVDKRIVLLSDLADGHSGGAQLGADMQPPLWAPLPELAAPLADCAVLRADRTGARIHADIACGPEASAAGRQVELVANGKTVASAPAPAGKNGDVTLDLPGEEPAEVTVRLTGHDAIAADDQAPAVVQAGPTAIAVVADEAEEATATGGAPIVEQALAALRLDLAVHPIPEPPEREGDLTDFVGLIIDDPPGLTPEQRHAVGAFVEHGGVLLLALGPRAAAAPLGASFEPVLGSAVAWGPSPVAGATTEGVSSELAESAASLLDLAPRGRATLTAADAANLLRESPLARWKDGAPLFARRTLGDGEAWVSTLPFSVGESDLPLRPAFLSLLDAWTTVARQRAAPRRGDVGTTWSFATARPTKVTGPDGDVPLASAVDTGGSTGAHLVPANVGAYRIAFGDRIEVRVAAPVESELDLRPRAIASAEAQGKSGGAHAEVDISWIVALVLLALLAAELGLRVLPRHAGREAPRDAPREGPAPS
jgi:hypothetical protein